MYVGIYVYQWMSYLEYRKSIVKGQNSYCACAASSAIFENKVTEKAGTAWIKFELAILHQNTSLSKLNGSLHKPFHILSYSLTLNF